MLALTACGALPASAAAASSPEVSQLPGTTGCLIDAALNNGAEGCGSVNQLGSPERVAISPDGKNVYVIAGTHNGETITAFSRASDGSLTQLPGPLGCLQHATSGCGALRGLDSGGNDIVVSPDGRDVYASSGQRIAVLARASDGSLSQLAGTAGCVSQDGTDGQGGTCTMARGAADFLAQWVYVSPDGRNVYSGQGPSTGAPLLTIFRRAADGSLSEAPDTTGCVSSDGTDFAGGVCAQSISGASNSSAMTISPDGRFAYVLSAYSLTLDAYSRDPATGGLTDLGCVVDRDNQANAPRCGPVRHFQDPVGIALSPGGDTLYVASRDTSTSTYDDGIDVFGRDTNSGAVTQLAGAAGCVTLLANDGESTSGPCGRARGVQVINGLALAPDGQAVYTVDNNYELGVFKRVADGTLSQPAGAAACHGTAGISPACTDDRGVGPLTAVAVTPDSQNVYAGGGTGMLAYARGAPTPQLNKTVTVGVVSGTILVKSPGASKFVKLSGNETVPTGSTVDSTHGTVALTSALDRRGHLQTGNFSAGQFRVTQQLHGALKPGALTVLTLSGPRPRACGAAREARGSASYRTLRGSGRGNFRSQGRYAAATVRGTKWVTEDRCDGTLVTVQQGIVSVRDFTLRRTVTVHAGHSYLAKARRARKH